jgi:pimeloyl-ACP methyl ester carboxylesterase
LAGHSFGGQIAIKFAAKYPDRVERLILIDSSGIRDWALKAVIKRKVFYVVSKIGKIFFKSTLARKFIYLLARERDYLNAPPLLRRTMSLVLDEQVIKDLDKIQAPTTIFWGENDQTTPVKIGQLIKSKIKNSQLVLIEGARHSPQYTHSQQLADLFLEKTKI